PFPYGHDAIIVYGRDSVGLAQAIATLTRLAAGEKIPAERELRLHNPTPQNGQIYADMQIPPTKAERVAVQGAERQALALLPPLGEIKMCEALLAGDRIYAKGESRIIAEEVHFFDIDLAKGKALRFATSEQSLRALSAQALRDRQGEAWPTPRAQAAGDGIIAASGRGLACLDEKNNLRWYYDPFSAPKTYDEVKYPRRCQRFILSNDKKWVLATWYDANFGGGYGPSVCIFNDGVTVLLEAETGREICRCPYLAGEMALADDGKRFLIVDNVDPDPPGRKRWNPQGSMAAVVCDQSGKAICRLPGEKVETIAFSANGRLAVLRYADTRRSITLLDVESGKSAEVRFPRVDVSAAAAPDGSFAVVTYSDGTVRCLSPDGKEIRAIQLPAPGCAVVGAGNAIAVCADDGKVYFPWSERPALAFGNAQAQALAAQPLIAPPGIAPPSLPFWENLGKMPNVRCQKIAAPPAEALAEIKGEKSIEIDLPALGQHDVALFTFTYRLAQPSDSLRLSFQAENGKSEVVQIYDYFHTPRPACAALRSGKRRVNIKFAAPHAAVSNTAIWRLTMENLANVSRVDLKAKTANPMTPRVFVPNIHGCLGDPRAEQVAFGFPSKGDFPLPPDLQGQRKITTDPASIFDGDVRSATPLYPGRPQGPGWMPACAIQTMRSARVLMEFASPCAVQAIALWEHPGDRPVSDYTIEYATEADMASAEKGEMEGNWVLAAEARDNTDYFRLHCFSQPIKARYWRYTITSTPCPVQRIAEIELYEPADARLEADLDTVEEKTGKKSAEDELERLGE
ncbi:MAG: SMP-30/gluconolactonase/LRE family protein, partial [Planctomycetota bacterium]|nr:SMP-30/gluconolactonase/LRE family protein [Planctomycetota bacterium]